MMDAQEFKKQIDEAACVLADGRFDYKLVRLDVLIDKCAMMNQRIEALENHATNDEQSIVAHQARIAALEKAVGDYDALQIDTRLQEHYEHAMTLHSRVVALEDHSMTLERDATHLFEDVADKVASKSMDMIGVKREDLKHLKLAAERLLLRYGDVADVVDMCDAVKAVLP